MIDSSRHFMPVEVVKRNLDAMAAVKLNVLHWHLVDDQASGSSAWPSRACTRRRRTATSTPAPRSARSRTTRRARHPGGARVRPARPRDGVGDRLPRAREPARALPDRAQLGHLRPTVNPIQEETYRFLDVFFAEMAALFDDQFMHIGGDENNGIQWAANPEIAAFMAREGYPTPWRCSATSTSGCSRSSPATASA